MVKLTRRVFFVVIVKLMSAIKNLLNDIQYVTEYRGIPLRYHSANLTIMRYPCTAIDARHLVDANN